MYSWLYDPVIDDVVYWVGVSGQRRVGMIRNKTIWRGLCDILLFDSDDEVEIDTEKLSLYHDYHNSNLCFHFQRSFVGIAGGGYWVCADPNCDERLST